MAEHTLSRRDQLERRKRYFLRFQTHATRDSMAWYTALSFMLDNGQINFSNPFIPLNRLVAVITSTEKEGVELINTVTCCKCGYELINEFPRLVIGTEKPLYSEAFSNGNYCTLTTRDVSKLNLLELVIDMEYVRTLPIYIHRLASNEDKLSDEYKVNLFKLRNEFNFRKSLHLRGLQFPTPLFQFGFESDRLSLIDIIGSNPKYTYGFYRQLTNLDTQLPTSNFSGTIATEIFDQVNGDLERFWSILFSKLGSDAVPLSDALSKFMLDNGYTRQDGGLIYYPAEALPPDLYEVGAQVVDMRPVLGLSLFNYKKLHEFENETIKEKDRAQIFTWRIRDNNNFRINERLDRVLPTARIAVSNLIGLKHKMIESKITIVESNKVS